MYKSILVAVDGSSCANRALTEISKLMPGDIQIHVVTVVEDPTSILASGYLPAIDMAALQESMVQAGREILERARETLSRLGIEGVTTHLVELSILDGQDVAKAIMTAANTYKADLIVMGTHGRRGFNRLLMGSVAEEALHLSPKPLLLIRETSSVAGPAMTASGVADSGFVA